MSKHVLGPWTYAHPAPHVWKIRDLSGSLIADYYGANSDENPQNEATARLIAASPHLLAALEFTMEHNQPNTSYGTPLDYIALSHNDVQVIRAAITAATAPAQAFVNSETDLVDELKIACRQTIDSVLANWRGNDGSLTVDTIYRLQALARIAGCHADFF